jgi:hypothetical protein
MREDAMSQLLDFGESESKSDPGFLAQALRSINCRHSATAYYHSLTTEQRVPY